MDIEFYKQYPDKFIEDFYGIKLSKIQKILLNVVKENEQLVIPRMRGYSSYKFFIYLIQDLLQVK